MEFNEDQMKDAKDFLRFYVDIMENYRSNFMCYLSEEVVLDWFGQTIKGNKNVSVFIKTTIATVKHFLSEGTPVKKIGFRDTHKIKMSRVTKNIPLCLMSPPRVFNQKTETKTPKKQMLPSTSSVKNKEDQKGQGDGPHNPTDSPESPQSPAKRFRPAFGDYEEHVEETVESECETNRMVRYVSADGKVEFHKPSFKKLQTETKWRRPCKLSVAYSSTNLKEWTIHLIIYEGNMKCRRNLMKDFESEEPEN